MSAPFYFFFHRVSIVKHYILSKILLLISQNIYFFILKNLDNYSCGPKFKYLKFKSSFYKHTIK